MEWDQELRAGQTYLQSQGTLLYEKTRLLRAYDSIVVPGILQTHDYVVGLYEAVALLYGLPAESDPEDAANARVPRRRLITQPTGRNEYSFVVEYSALTDVIGSPEVMDEQLGFLTYATTLPHVVLGVIPPGVTRTLYPGEGFYIFDDQLVRSSIWSGEIRTDKPDEIAFFVRAFDLLRDQAVYGDPARELIESARAELRNRE
ncbi:DUF5753 domain-containing protein [Actinoallomurus soli]|uniref:DUF5753 domain-containing protein n=1 Tax=Actinoallomurus soli TaxID=2952535 RepID=UPI0020922650|nr:DUF5753 domain-containing protein [Actinoallomurus soli]MCO5974062.1 DUF5753 domain-containing protein [Actinoallomurus soli]